MSSTTAPAAIDEFRAAVSLRAPGVVFQDRGERVAVDECLPDVTCAPAIESDVSAILSEASACGLSVVPYAAGAHMGGANVPREYDVAMLMTRLDRIVAHEPADMTVTAEAGAPISALNATLAAHNQFLPLDPPAADRATVGGVIAANAHGPLRHRYGTVRDWLLGVRVVHADGSISKAGGRVVKNVTGYEMTKLYCGSFGTLGVVTEATLKLAPAPPVRVTVAAQFDTASAAGLYAMAAHDAGLAIDAAELLSPPATYALFGEPRWCVLARAAGGPGAIERTLRELRAYAGAMRGALRECDEATWAAWARALEPGVLALRASVLPSRVAETVEVLDRRFAGAAALLSATVSAGLIRANLDPTRGIRGGTLYESARDVVARRGGTVAIDAAPASLKRQYDVFGAERADIAIMRRIKQEFDPRGTLSRGRFAGRI